jgi:ornithine cyclodeaminase/alanine dehydrogenase-like protein (mu-crystallin family)
MEKIETLILKSSDVRQVLTIDGCMDAVENIFELYALQKTTPPKVLGMHAKGGGFHIKAGMLELEKTYFAAKINANFPNNPTQNRLPSIQGVIALFDGVNGRLLALIDSIEVTIIRTGAATGVAAKYLALKDAKTATICGCGNQGIISLKALLKVLKIERVFAFDCDIAQTEKLRQHFVDKTEIIAVDENILPAALAQSQVCVTCTPSKQPFIKAEYIAPGTFIAAVGADSEEKRELFASLVANSKLITDVTGQCATIGELHHAIEQGLMQASSVHAELGEVIAGVKPGRVCAGEVIIFDSTGTALQDVASAAIIYEKAIASGLGTKIQFYQ